MIEAISPAKFEEFLHIAALDRLAWVHTGEQFIADGEHVWRVWCEYATVLVARVQQGDALPESGNIAAALVMFPTVQQELFLHKVMVHPELRGRGIGTRLLEAAIEKADAPLLLTVAPENTAAVQLYEKSGFSIRERIGGYYRPHEDRYLMVHQPCA